MRPRIEPWKSTVRIAVGDMVELRRRYTYVVPFKSGCLDIAFETEHQ